MANDVSNCNCLTGTAVIDTDGNCRCINDGDTGGGGPVPPLMAPRVRAYLTPQTINYNYNVPMAPASPMANALADATAARAPGNSQPATLFGMSPLVVLGLAAAGLYMFSGKEGKTK